MQQKKITLYGYATSPYVQKVNAFLVYKQLSYNTVFVDPVSARELKFTRQRQVPILQIGKEWRKDSTPLGLWLDECFPDRPIGGVGAEEQARILTADRWVNERFIPQMLFRRAVRWESVGAGFYRGWRLSSLLNSTQPLPLYLRVMWPLILRKVGFIHQVLKDTHTDMHESYSEITQRIAHEFVEQLDGGPFLAGRDGPSLADLSLYGIAINGYLMMAPTWMPEYKIKPPEPMWTWMRNVQSRLQQVPLLAPKKMCLRPCPFAVDDGETP